MKSLKLISFSTVSALVLAAPGSYAAPSVSIGENAALFATATAAAEYNTNVFRATSDSESDVSFVLTPGAELRVGGQGLMQTTARLGYEVRRFADYGDLDGEYVKSSLTATYDSGVTLFKGNASFNEFGTTSGTDDPNNLGELLVQVNERSELKAGGEVKYRISDSLAFGGGLQFSNRSYEASGGIRTLNDLDRFDVPLKVFYAIAPRLDALVGYRYRTVTVAKYASGVGPGTIPDYTDNYFFVGLDGELFNPLWAISLDLGYQERDFENVSGSSDNFTMNARITYSAASNRSYYAMISRDYNVSPSNAASYIRDQVTVGGNYRLSETFSVSGSVSYLKSDYESSPRSEDLLLGIVGVTYSPNEYLSFRGQAKLTTVDGEGGGLEYDQEVFSVSASFRY